MAYTVVGDQTEQKYYSHVGIPPITISSSKTVIIPFSSTVLCGARMLIIYCEKNDNGAGMLIIFKFYHSKEGHLNDKYIAKLRCKLTAVLLYAIHFVTRPLLNSHYCSVFVSARLFPFHANSSFRTPFRLVD